MRWIAGLPMWKSKDSRLTSRCVNGAKNFLKKEITYEEYLALLREKAHKSALSEEGMLHRE